MNESPDIEKLSFKAFLSHRYKSPEVNLYFYDLLSVGNAQFTVDVGIKSTNVTRLERAVRGSDAFIGLYPYSGPEGGVRSEEELRSASKYFRLELDLALRARRPTLVFYDNRLGEILDLPASVWSKGFDMAEIAGGGGSPERGTYETIIRRFYQHVRASKREAAAEPIGKKRRRAACLLPTGVKGYKPRHIEAVRTIAGEHGVLKLTELNWPPTLDLSFLSKLDEIDWLFVDVSPGGLSSGIVGFLHGRGVPMLRLWKGADPAGQTIDAPEHQLLFAGVEVGYRKDIVRWKRIEQLRAGVRARLQTLLLPPKRISTEQDARSYFKAAALRKEKVFLSYSGRDSEWGDRIAKALLEDFFQTVFNYKDGESITVGESWVEEIFDAIAVTELAVPLMTSSYLASDNCMHEAQEFVAARDSKKTHLVPVKLHEGEIDRPTWMRNRQYLHVYAQENDVRRVVDRIVESFDRWLAKTAATRP